MQMKTKGAMENNMANANNASTEVRANSMDPRNELARWANEGPEWARMIVGEALQEPGNVDEPFIRAVYSMMRQEAGVDQRTLPEVKALSLVALSEDRARPLKITKISNVSGVNALTSTSEIMPSDGLTILYGENGTGKTGYSRILKAMAGSRTADEVLGDVLTDSSETAEQSAKVEYELDGVMKQLCWRGERGVDPFQRMSIFDSRGVGIHVDGTLEYVFTPSALRPFGTVVEGMHSLSGKLQADIKSLNPDKKALLAKFQQGTSVYSLIEKLSGETDLNQLRVKASKLEDVQERMNKLRLEIATLQSGSAKGEITGLQFERKALIQWQDILDKLESFDCQTFNAEIDNNLTVRKDQEIFRSGFFEAARLPSEPNRHWENFIRAGEEYRHSLELKNEYDSECCLYCRQRMDEGALELIQRYRGYLTNEASRAINESDKALAKMVAPFRSLGLQDLETHLEILDGTGEGLFLAHLKKMKETTSELAQMSMGAMSRINFSLPFSDIAAELKARLSNIDGDIEKLVNLQNDTGKKLEDKEKELGELGASLALHDSWGDVEEYVNAEVERASLELLRLQLSNKSRVITQMMNAASESLLNRNFESLFYEECTALRAPEIKIQFSGKQGKAQRKKTLIGRYRPSLVFSEGEQKVLALADFLAETRVGGSAAPVVLDDPVSSLDHRRIDEVAQRVVALARTCQVIVFTHDIFFASRLLQLMEKSDRVGYYKITDEHGKGHVTKATGARFDSLKNMKARVNTAIQTASQTDGEEREAKVREGYVNRPGLVRGHDVTQEEHHGYQPLRPGDPPAGGAPVFRGAR